VTAPARVRLDAFGTGARTALEALARVLGPERQAWVVGGAVRDALAGSGPGDLDIAVPSGAVALARELADLLGAAFHVLDEARGAARIAAGPGRAWQGPQVDIADFRAPGLTGDLRGRDFTVNALALAVRRLVAAGEADVEDPAGGLKDLEARTVRLCAPRSF
jgi:tRNA nucleotidyltransferase/poly(A) polymerase